MAQHRIYDVVQVIDFEERAAGQTFRGIITDILYDADDGLADSNQSVYEIGEANNTDMWEVTDNQILTLQEVEQAIAASAPIPIIGQGEATIEEAEFRRMLFDEEMIDPIQAVTPAEEVAATQDQTETQDPIPQRNPFGTGNVEARTPLNAPIQGRLETFADGSISLHADGGMHFNFTNIEQYVQWLDMTDTVIRPQPIARDIGRETILAERHGLTPSDYRPYVGGARPLYTYTIEQGFGMPNINLRPVLLENTNKYAFWDQFDEEWISEHDNYQLVQSALDRPRDHVGQRWARRRDTIEQPTRVGTFADYATTKKAPKSRKKHLRRRTAMPEIKEAKYYGSKDFIG